MPIAPRHAATNMNNQPCTSCGGPLRPGARFCAQCGAPQAAAPAAQSDAELAQRLGQGDEAAFAALYGRYARPVDDFVARIVREPATAEDVTQATFVQVWEQRDALRSPEAVKRWIYQIAHQFALKQVTRGPATVAIEEELQLAAMEPGPEESAVSADAARLVWDAAASLEPHQLAILDLSVRCGLASSEIAEILAVDTARASLQVNRAKEALGNAVRYLLVARRRSHCERLAELVPAGVGQLTPEQRATVDRPMRRCPACQGMALRLTAPEELFGALLLLPLPGKLTTPPHAVLTAAHLGAGQALSTVARPRPAPRPGLRALRHPNPMQAVAAGVAAVAVVAGVAFGVSRIAAHPGPGSVTPAPASQPVGSQSATPSPTPPAAPMTWTVTSVLSYQWQTVTCPSVDFCMGVAFPPSPDEVLQYVSADPAGGAAAWTIAANQGPVAMVMCPTTNLCVATDQGGDFDEITDPAGATSIWSMVQVSVADGNACSPGQSSCSLGGPAAISCPSPDFCAAVEEGAIVTSTDLAAAAWSVEFNGTPSLAVTGVSCPTPDLCVASGYDGEVLTSSAPTGAASTWTANDIDGSTPLLGISCPTVTLCVAFDQDGDVLTSTDPRNASSPWTVTNVDGTPPLTELSCPTDGLCAAVDDQGDVITSTDPTGGAVDWTTSDVDGSTALKAVSCPTVDLCLAVDGNGNVAVGT